MLPALQGRLPRVGGPLAARAGAGAGHWLTASAYYSAPPPVAWVLSGGPCAAARAGRTTALLLAGPSPPAAATCGPVPPGMRATGARCVRPTGGGAHSRRCLTRLRPCWCDLPQPHPLLAASFPRLSSPCPFLPIPSRQPRPASGTFGDMLQLGVALTQWFVRIPVPRRPVLPQLWWRFLCAGRAVCGHTGPPATPALPLPGRAYTAARPPALRGPALPQLVHLLLEGGEA